MLLLVFGAGCWRDEVIVRPALSPTTSSQPAVASTPRRSVDPRLQPEESLVGEYVGNELRPAAQLSLVSGAHYGWRIRLPCTKPILFRETLRLPAPTQWTLSDPNVEISADQATAITHEYAPCVDGWIEHGWLVNRDDPPGRYVITVEIEGYATQRYRVEFR